MKPGLGTTGEGPFWIDRRDAPPRESVRFVLIGTTEPGNIGAAARGMKAMGFRRLVLVGPAEGWMTAHAAAMAHGAEELLEEAEVRETLDEALRGCTWVVGTTRRPRRHQAETVTPREWGAELAAVPRGEEVAILFGPEKTGLTNEDVLRCRLVVTIPSPVDYPSLNLAQTVMLMAYESGLALREPAERAGSPALASDEELERMYAHVEEALHASRMNEKKVRSMMRHLRIILARAGLSKDDTSTFHTLAARIRGPRPRAKREHDS
ncbi:MAG: TrmJ/YjtD family RNA methyltransferase [Candidatus Eisenbacteria bacterium]